MSKKFFGLDKTLIDVCEQVISEPLVLNETLDKKHKSLLITTIDESDDHDGYDLDDYDAEFKSCKCPTCGGSAETLGSLGKKVHCRCSACGMEFSKDMKSESFAGTYAAMYTIDKIKKKEKAAPATEETEEKIDETVAVVPKKKKGFKIFVKLGENAPIQEDIDLPLKFRPDGSVDTSNLSPKQLWDYHTRVKHLAGPAPDPGEYPNKDSEGLEGPFRLMSGLVVYYDRKEGKYYDSKKDMYLSHDEYDSHSNKR